MTVIIERAWLDHNGHHIGIQVQAYSIPPRNLDEIELCPKLRGIGAKCVQSDVRVVRRSVNACVSGKSGPTYAGVLRFQLPQTMMLRNDDTPSSFFSRQGGDLYLLYGKNENISPVSIRDHLCLGRVDQFEANKGIRRKLMSDEEIQQAKEKEDQRQRRLLRTPPTPKEVNLHSPNASQTRINLHSPKATQIPQEPSIQFAYNPSISSNQKPRQSIARPMPPSQPHVRTLHLKPVFEQTHYIPPITKLPHNIPMQIPYQQPIPIQSISVDLLKVNFQPSTCRLLLEVKFTLPANLPKHARQNMLFDVLSRVNSTAKVVMFNEKKDVSWKCADVRRVLNEQANPGSPNLSNTVPIEAPQSHVGECNVAWILFRVDEKYDPRRAYVHYGVDGINANFLIGFAED